MLWLVLTPWDAISIIGRAQFRQYIPVVSARTRSWRPHYHKHVRLGHSWVVEHLKLCYINISNARHKSGCVAKPRNFNQTVNSYYSVVSEHEWATWMWRGITSVVKALRTRGCWWSMARGRLETQAPSHQVAIFFVLLAPYVTCVS